MILILSIIIWIARAIDANKNGGGGQFRDFFKEALDDMEVRFNGPNRTFDEKMYRKFVQCFNKFNDTSLYES